MKIHIFCNLTDKPWGGANQFLKALRRDFTSRQMYCAQPEQADVILFNSFLFGSYEPLLWELLRFKLQYPEKLLICRLDGPIWLIREKDLALDKIIYLYNQMLADGTIFQSEWSRRENYRLGLGQNRFETTILNAPDPALFNQDAPHPFTAGRKVRLIATSWSSNWKKGFAAYQWLDQHLDFQRYDLTFIGNTPVAFQRIRHIPPLASHELAGQLKAHDIFITASQKDPCSNALIEALHCGLPAVAYDDGGHPEIVGQAGALFQQPAQIPALLERIVADYAAYQANIRLPTIADVGRRYADFMASVHAATQRGEYCAKALTAGNYLNITRVLLSWKATERLKRLTHRLDVTRQYR
jgi:hypothetical protein